MGEPSDAAFWCPGCRRSLEGIANTKVSEGSITSTEGAPATSPRPDSATNDAGCTVKMAQLPNAFWKQLLSQCFCTLCSVRPWSETALKAAGSEQHCAHRRHSRRCCFGAWRTAPNAPLRRVVCDSCYAGLLLVGRGGSWITRFSQALASVATGSEVAERRQPKRGPVRIM